MPTRRSLVLSATGFLAVGSLSRPLAFAASRPAAPNLAATPSATQPKTLAQLQEEATRIQSELARVRELLPSMAHRLSAHVHNYSYIHLGIETLVINGANIAVFVPSPVHASILATGAAQNATPPEAPAAAPHPNLAQTDMNAFTQYLPLLAQEIDTAQRVVDAFTSTYAKHTHTFTDHYQGLISEKIGNAQIPLAIATEVRDLTESTKSPTTPKDTTAAPSNSLPLLYQPTPQETYLDALTKKATHLSTTTAGLYAAIDGHVHEYARNDFPAFTMPYNRFDVAVCEARGPITMLTTPPFVPPNA